MAVETFTRPYDYDPSVTKEVVVAEPHTIPASAPYSVYLRHIPRQQTPSTVAISGASTTWTEVATPPSASGEYRVRYDEALGRIEFHSSDAGKAITVNYNACGTVIWAEDYADGRPNTAEMQEVLERVQEASGIDYASAVSGFSSSDVKAALDALAGVRIVEMGTNANGTYVRWENGFQICFSKVALSYSTATRLRTTWTYPAAFLAETTLPYVSHMLGGSAEDMINFTIESQYVADFVVPSAQSVITGMVCTGADATTSVKVYILAVGRWK